jgi:phosphoribosylformylglycinamidine synthase
VGDAIALVGPFAPSLAGSELAKLLGHTPRGKIPAVEPAFIRDAHELVRESVRSGKFHSAHDVAEGGLAVALAECCVAGGIGASVELPDYLHPFAEAPGRGFIVSGREEDLADALIIGRVGGAELEIQGELKLAVSELESAREAGLGELV